jgi:hypothetical protein
MQEAVSQNLDAGTHSDQNPFHRRFQPMRIPKHVVI